MGSPGESSFDCHIVLSGFGARVHSSQFIQLSCFPSCLQGVCAERMMMKPPNPLSGRRREREAMGEFILLSYYPICVLGTDRIDLGKGKVAGA